MADVLPLVQALLRGRPLSAAEASTFFAAVVQGAVEPPLLAAAIAAIQVRGATAEELAAAAAALLEAATPFPRPEVEFADVVGTGGDGQNTLNLSTLVAFAAAACGVPIVKHGNRSISSRSGSFDLLQALGIPGDVDPAVARRAFDRHRICFLFAPAYHPGLRHAAEVRRALRAPTIFNLLGPLINPARPPRMLLGVARPEWIEPMAGALQRLGCARALIVHGSGIDEVAIHGPTDWLEIDGAARRRGRWTPADFGLDPAPLDALRCDDPRASHARAQAVLAGRGSKAEIGAVAVNAAALLHLFDRPNLPQNAAEVRTRLGEGRLADLVRRMAGEPRE